MQYPKPPKPTKKGRKRVPVGPKESMYPLDRKPAVAPPKKKSMYTLERKPAVAPPKKKSMYTLERKPAVKGSKPKFGNPKYQVPRKPKRGSA